MKKYYVFGSCHIDLAWRSEAAYHQKLLEKMTERVLELLDEYPDMTYVLEQANHYRTLASYRPDLIARLKERIAEGRLEVVGGMSSSLETNMPNGEGFIRNQLIGLDWFEKNLDAKITTGWLIDTFGINAQIPQILSKCGIKYLQANRFGGDKSFEIFYDKALDGSKVLVVGRDAFSRNLPFTKDTRIFFRQTYSDETLDQYFNDMKNSEVDGPILVNAYIEEVPPTERLPYNVKLLNEKLLEDGTGTAEFKLPRDFFEVLESAVDEIPELYGDLNPEFTGTFAQRNVIKLDNRRTENMLIDAEKWLALIGSAKYSEFHDTIISGWINLAFVHFHDVFTGSHPDRVMQDVLSRLTTIRGDAKTMFEAAFASDQSCTHEFSLVNSLPFDRSTIAEIDAPCDGDFDVMVGDDTVNAYRSGDKLRFVADIPAMSAAACRLIAKDTSDEDETIEAADEIQLENQWLVLKLSSRNGVYLEHKPSGKVLLDNVKDLIIAQHDNGNFQYENISGSEYYLWRDGTTVGLSESNGSWQKAFAKLYYGKTACKVEFLMRADSPVLGLDISVDWQEEETRLRLKLNTPIQPVNDGLYEVPFGVVRRKPYTPGVNRKGEWPAQRFTAIDNGEIGLALINRGVCGVEIMNGQLWTTLLRSPSANYIGMKPDETSSQHGSHVFAFELLAYEGDWSGADLVREAQSFNSPLYAVNGGAAYETQVKIDNSNIILSSVKYPEEYEDGVIVVRAYETIGAQTDHCRIYVNGAVRAVETDMRENSVKELVCKDGYIEADFGAFEIKTVKIYR